MGRENEQAAAVIRAEIQAMVANYQRNITVTVNQANAAANLATKNAEAEASRRMIDAENTALKQVAANLNLSEEGMVQYQENFAYQTIKNASFLFGVQNAVTVLGGAAASSVAPSPTPSCN